MVSNKRRASLAAEQWQHAALQGPDRWGPCEKYPVGALVFVHSQISVQSITRGGARCKQSGKLAVVYSGHIVRVSPSVVGEYSAGTGIAALRHHVCWAVLWAAEALRASWMVWQAASGTQPCTSPAGWVMPFLRVSSGSSISRHHWCWRHPAARASPAA